MATLPPRGLDVSHLPDSTGPSVAQRLLEGGVPPSLLVDLLDPVGMRVALTAELLDSELVLLAADAPAVVDLTEHSSSRTA